MRPTNTSLDLALVTEMLLTTELQSFRLNTVLVKTIIYCFPECETVKFGWQLATLRSNMLPPF